jgi:hypothetical protein
VLAAGNGVEAVVAEAGVGGVEVGDVDGDVGARGDDGVGLVHEVDLGAVALEPGVAVGEGRRRLDGLEAEQLEEEGGAVDIGREDLDADVLEHQVAGWSIRAGATLGQRG